MSKRFQATPAPSTVHDSADILAALTERDHLILDALGSSPSLDRIAIAVQSRLAPEEVATGLQHLEELGLVHPVEHSDGTNGVYAVNREALTAVS